MKSGVNTIDVNRLAGTLPVIPTPFLNGIIDFDSHSRLFKFVFLALKGYAIGGSTREVEDHCGKTNKA
jgi:dihydrodipicolinate synthase/N-acetylneuraminate lyase